MKEEEKALHTIGRTQSEECKPAQKPSHTVLAVISSALWLVSILAEDDAQHKAEEQAVRALVTCGRTQTDRHRHKSHVAGIFPLELYTQAAEDQEERWL